MINGDNIYLNWQNGEYVYLFLSARIILIWITYFIFFFFIHDDSFCHSDNKRYWNVSDHILKADKTKQPMFNSLMHVLSYCVSIFYNYFQWICSMFNVHCSLFPLISFILFMYAVYKVTFIWIPFRVLLSIKFATVFRFDER